MNATQTNKKTILILTAQYLPGFKAGGQIKATVGLVEYLGRDFIFKIITNDRDLHDTHRYNDVKSHEWQRVGNADVYYYSLEDRNILGIREVINSVNYDVLYMSSFFNPQFTILPLFLRRIGMIRRTPTIVATHGEFSRGAIVLKRYKKKIYMLISRFLGFFDGIQWHVSNEIEKNDVECELYRKGVGRSDLTNSIVIAPDIILDQIMGHTLSIRQHSKKEPNMLKVIFLSRICVMKNLKYALRILQDVRSRIHFDIYGPIDEDKKYWKECVRIIEDLPKNISTRYLGPIDACKVQETFALYDLFFLPTMGENFGYVIMESLNSGCPVLISDQTPWTDVEIKHAGWIVALNRPERFKYIIETLSQLSNEEYQSYYKSAFKLAQEKIDNKDIFEKNRQMFLNCN